MIVPQRRLLIWTAAALPLLAVAAFLPHGLYLVTAVFGALLLFAGVDAVLAPRGLEGLSVEAPEVVRFSLNREGMVPVQIRNDSQSQRPLRIGLPLAREFDSAVEDLQALLPPSTQYSKVQWLCTPRKRGRYVMDRIYREAPSPLGLWGYRDSAPVRCELRVYPDLMEDRKRVAALFLNRFALGVHSQRMIGQGREFEKLREYIPGDGYDQVHWKATAKRGKPVTKVFQIERTQEVYVAIDFSRLSGRRIGDDSVLEHFLKSALVLGQVAQRQGDLFGLITFSDRVEGFLRAAGGKAHYTACRDAIYRLQPERVTPDFDDLFSFIRLRLRRRALVILLTDLNDPILAESFARSAELVARQHLMIVNMIRPPGALPVFSEPDANTADSLYGKLSGHLVWQNLAELQKKLRRHGILLSQLDDSRMSADLVTQYLNIKQRQQI